MSGIFNNVACTYYDSTLQTGINDKSDAFTAPKHTSQNQGYQAENVIDHKACIRQQRNWKWHCLYAAMHVIKLHN